MSGVTHIVGAGLAGLSCAVRLVGEGRRVALYDSARFAGGRCRSYYDGSLDLTIDNGNHLLLSGNRAALDYADRIGASDALVGPIECAFDFLDVRTQERWRLRPNSSRLPWWIFSRDRRVPSSKPSDYLGALELLRAKPDATIAQAMDCAGPLYERLWQPVLLAALNTDPREASAMLAGEVLRQSLAMGGAACRPLVARQGLGAAFVEPALRLLAARGVSPRFGARLRSIEFSANRATRLCFGEEVVEVDVEDSIVLAVPSWIATELLPGLTAPDEYRAILNAHFKIAPPPGAPLLLGLVGALSEWLFAFDDRLSVTISGADRLMETPRAELAAKIWGEVAAATGLSGPMPVWQIVKEKRATFAATPQQERRRPTAATRWENLFLAGDWTATGLPATIEGAVRSGERAAQLIGAKQDSFA